MPSLAALFVLLTVVSISTHKVWSISRKSDDPEPLEALVQQLSQDFQVLQADHEALKTKVANQDTEIANLKAENQRRVAFSAFLPEPGQIQASKGAIVPFSSEITNVGNAYNKATGVFTCPFDGDYFFAVSVDVSSEYEALTLRKNGVIVVYADKDDTVSTHVSASTVLSLKQGDVVSVNQGASAGHLDTGSSGARMLQTPAIINHIL